MSNDTIIDLTESFTLVNHCALSDEVIDLDADDSLNVSSVNENKPKSTDVKKQESKSKNTNGLYGESYRNFGDCPICWEERGINPLASTICGHVYCLKCLQAALRIERKCPTCRRVLNGKHAYHPLYLRTS